MANYNLAGNTPQVDAVQIVADNTGTALTVQPTIYAAATGGSAPTFSAPKGSLCLNTTGAGTTSRLWVNTNGSTTWTNVGTSGA